jgi:hypothetical protein
MPKRTLAFLLAVGALGVATSCANLIGADEEVANAAAELCKCVPDDPMLAQALGPPAACASELSRRLEAAREDVRAAWLDHYASVCAGRCKTDTDPALWKQCFYQSPTCSLGSCFNDAECCGVASGETCNSVCLPPGAT